MKIIRNACLLLIGIAATTLVASAQDPGQRIVPPPVAAPPPVGHLPPPDLSPSEPRFDLDFQGGTPGELVKAIEKAAGVPINAIVPDEYKGVSLPKLKLKNVTVAEVFQGLSLSTEKRVTYPTGFVPGGQPTGYQITTINSGFRTGDRVGSSRSIWYFYSSSEPKVPLPPEEVKTCRFWMLEPYLEKLKVDDITTAIETGWKMLGKNPLPKMSFHKDTKLLIVVGTTQELSLVDDVLRQLAPTKNVAAANFADRLEKIVRAAELNSETNKPIAKSERTPPGSSGSAKP